VQAPLPTAELVDHRRRPLRFEIALVVMVSMAVMVPGIWSYSLVDPWETHYGEVARTMLQDDDFVKTNWVGTSTGSPTEVEGFRSKPVLMFWMMSAGLRMVGAAEDGGYSGEMTDSVRIMVGIRMPFICAAIFGLTMLWWMLARLVSRRLAWLALLVVGSTPIFCMIGRNAIPDMPMVACTAGAIALFLLAMEDGDRPITTRGSMFRGRFFYDARHIVLGISCGFVVLQAIYYAVFFAGGPTLGIRGAIPNPAIWLPGLMLWLMCGLSRDGWLIVRLPLVLIGGVIAAIVNEPMPARRPGQTMWRHVFDDIMTPWERHSLDRYIVRGLAFPLVMLAGGTREPWPTTNLVADRVLGMQPLTTMRQLYLLGMYFLLGVSLLAKGPPGFTVVVLVCFFHLVFLNRWTQFYEGAYEIKRGLVMMIIVAIPWHIGMWLKEGLRFVDEYFYTHILNRAGAGVDNSPGTFEYYTNQLGHGMWLWAALLPAAFAATLLRSGRETKEQRVRFTLGLWAVLATALFCLVQTKFHHYILPAIPGLALLVAWYLDDLLAKRERLHPLYAAIAIGIVFLVTRDLMYEPERWIEMFVFRYDRPWPTAEPYAIDTSDGFLALGLFAACALAVAATRYVRLGVAMVCAAGLAICIWALQVYMPIAGTHWGMRDAVRAYYDNRTVYGEKLVYFGYGQLYDEWKDEDDVRTFETMIPQTLQVGQPMTVTIQVNKVEDERVVEMTEELIGTCTAIGEHSVELTLVPGQRDKLKNALARGKDGKRGVRKPIKVVDADRLIAWQLYWRGENFWAGGEIWSFLPEMKTSLPNPNNVEFNKYINDRARAPIGRRYFVVTEAGRLTGIRSLLPTPRARESFEVLNTTSNKFSLGAFDL
jgi:4-amino-4-deoxy-L-arabinose transferase-like glycosyltransferase